jgi:lysophospholipase L1-like esterase
VENPPALRFYERNLTEMIRACRRAGVQVALLRPSVDPARIRSTGVRIGTGIVPKADFLELLHAFMAVEQGVADRERVALVAHRFTEGPDSLDRMFIDPVHLNGEGNRMLAEDVAAVLLGKELLRVR